MATQDDVADDWRARCGPLGPLLEDVAVTEIMVNGPDRIFVERDGRLQHQPGIAFESADEQVALMCRLASAIGRTLDAQNPFADGRLPDGSRINCVLPSVAVDGPALTIRKFSPKATSLEELIALGTLDQRLATFLDCCVRARVNLIVSGGTGSGKTTLLNALSRHVPAHERIICIEDTAELELHAENHVRLEARAPTPGDPGVTVRSLVINALRMRPDRIIVGESRGPEAFDMLVAMNTGHDGSMATVHASSARDALRRLETMVLMAGSTMTSPVIRQNIAAALDLVIYVKRFPDGTRRIAETIEVSRMEQEVILTQDVFTYAPGEGFKSRGLVPSFVEHFRERGVEIAPGFFARG